MMYDMMLFFCLISGPFFDYYSLTYPFSLSFSVSFSISFSFSLSFSFLFLFPLIRFFIFTYFDLYDTNKVLLVFDMHSSASILLLDPGLLIP